MRLAWPGSGNTRDLTEATRTDAMARITTITNSAGRVTTIVTRRPSGCGGCLVALAVVVAVFAPLSMPPALMVLAYIVDAVVFGAGIVQWINRHRAHRPAPPPVRQPLPPAL